jgi:DNA ligase D-like protein (predicted polymerase)/DNA ligase D-like protein (predicted 3'-phosphoesterase)
MSLAKYNSKRDFDETTEPKATVDKSDAPVFVIQRHEASRLHYDFRLELGGVLKSWAVPKGPTLYPADKRLAVLVEDHPISYAKFKGTIPEGNYGAGRVEIWDSGSFYFVDENSNEITEAEAKKWFKSGQLKFSLKGRKLKGEFALVQLKKDETGKSWLLIKHKDKYATSVAYNSEDQVNASTNQTKASNVNEQPASLIPASGDSPYKVGRKTVPLTNLNKVYWPQEGYTKGDMIRYYESVSKFILPYLKNRPLSLKRNPNGITEEGFYHKDAGENAPAWMKVENIYSDSSHKIIHYLVCNDLPSLVYIANLGCIEMNPWNSRVGTLDNPDYMVIDLDPADENSFEQVIEAANVVHEIFSKNGAESYCKTSGASGLHIYIPMGAKYTYEQVKEFGHIIATMVVEQIPSFTTIERPLNKRKGRMYIDFLQNRQGQTLASAYSIRPKPGATVSTPLEWKEVKKGLHPSQFTIKNVISRFEKNGDLFEGALKKGIDLNRFLKSLG